MAFRTPLKFITKEDNAKQSRISYDDNGYLLLDGCYVDNTEQMQYVIKCVREQEELHNICSIEPIYIFPKEKELSKEEKEFNLLKSLEKINKDI